MRTTLIILLAMSGAVVVTAGPVLSKKAQTQALEQQAAPSSGMLRTMPHGAYECALPGDAGGKAYRVVAEEGFLQKQKKELEFVVVLLMTVMPGITKCLYQHRSNDGDERKRGLTWNDTTDKTNVTRDLSSSRCFCMCPL